MAPWNHTLGRLGNGDVGACSRKLPWTSQPACSAGGSLHLALEFPKPACRFSTAIVEPLGRKHFIPAGRNKPSKLWHQEVLTNLANVHQGDTLEGIIKISVRGMDPTWRYRTFPCSPPEYPHKHEKKNFLKGLVTTPLRGPLFRAASSSSFPLEPSSLWTSVACATPFLSILESKHTAGIYHLSMLQCPPLSN